MRRRYTTTRTFLRRCRAIVGVELRGKCDGDKRAHALAHVRKAIRQSRIHESLPAPHVKDQFWCSIARYLRNRFDAPVAYKHRNVRNVERLKLERVLWTIEDTGEVGVQRKADFVRRRVDRVAQPGDVPLTADIEARRLVETNVVDRAEDTQRLFAQISRRLLEKLLVVEAVRHVEGIDDVDGSFGIRVVGKQVTS